MSNFDSNNLWTQRSVDDKYQLTLSIYERNASFSVFSTDKSASRKPVARIPINLGSALHLSEQCKKLTNSDGPTRISFCPQHWDRESSKFINDDGLILFRDDKRRYGLDIITKSGEPMQFLFKNPGSFTDGAEPMSAEKRSEIGLKVFMHVLSVQFSIALLLCRLDPVTPRGGRRNNNSSSQSSMSPNSASDADYTWPN